MCVSVCVPHIYWVVENVSARACYIHLSVVSHVSGTEDRSGLVTQSLFDLFFLACWTSSGGQVAFTYAPIQKNRPPPAGKQTSSFTTAPTHAEFSVHLHHLLTSLPSSGSCAVRGGGWCRAGQHRLSNGLDYKPPKSGGKEKKKKQTDGGKEPIREQKSLALVSSDTLTRCLRVTMATEGVMQRETGGGVLL